MRIQEKYVKITFTIFQRIIMLKNFSPYHNLTHFKLHYCIAYYISEVFFTLLGAQFFHMLKYLCLLIVVTINKILKFTMTEFK